MIKIRIAVVSEGRLLWAEYLRFVYFIEYKLYLRKKKKRRCSLCILLPGWVTHYIFIHFPPTGLLLSKKIGGDLQGCVAFIVFIREASWVILHEGQQLRWNQMWGEPSVYMLGSAEHFLKGETKEASRRKSPGRRNTIPLPIANSSSDQRTETQEKFLLCCLRERQLYNQAPV